MRFEPLTEEQIQTQSLLPDGVYSYQVIKSEEKVSKTNNEYISLVLMVWDNEGKEHTVFTNLALMKLLKHFCDVNGLQNDYNSGNVRAENIIGKSSGKVVLGIEGEKPDGKGGTYKAKNIVKDYIGGLPGSTLQPIKQESSGETFTDDDLPF